MGEGSLNMRIGLVFPQTEFPCDPSPIRDYTQTAEELGFAHILAYDHVVGVSTEAPGAENFPYTFNDSFMEPLTLFAFMSACSNRLEFASGVIILPQRQTALFAKQTAGLDVLCQGRLRVGVGLGWNEAEYIALGEDFHNRGGRIEEQVQVLRMLWMNPLVSFSGRWHQIPNIGLNPMPIQRPIPLWFGGSAAPALRRAARLGDGWMISTSGDLDIHAELEIISRTLDENGRNHSDFGLEARISYGDGDPDKWLKQVKYWEKMGASHLSFNTMNSGLRDGRAHIQAIEQFAAVVSPTV
jgi:probable F420-dependent oxidoreductase